ncbi:Pkinase-domain-containing protein [Backusella circina FSU 941]|nr:Pkinase-domain-containing protein [Backusella circina FSU 941]
MIVEIRRNQYSNNNNNSRSSTEESEPTTPCQDSLYSFKFTQSPWKDDVAFLKLQKDTSQPLLEQHQYHSLAPIVDNNHNINPNTTTNHTLQLSHQHYANHSIDHYLPQNQAIITTTEENGWTISLANSVATQLFDYKDTHNLVDINILDLIDSNYHHLLSREIENRRKALGYNGGVLICGEVIPILKRGNIKTSASLWLKEKKQDETSVFIWIFEQVDQNIVTLELDTNKNTILSATRDVNDLYGYAQNELINQPITLLISRYNLLEKYFISQSKKGIRFPVIVEHLPEAQRNVAMIRITSIPTLSGLVTVKQDSQTIESCNAVFAKYLFGYSMKNLANIPITHLLPQFPTILSGLEKQDNSEILVLNNSTCRQMLVSTNKQTIQEQRQVQKNSFLLNNNNEASLPVMTAIHRDGTPFEIDLQIRLDDKSCDKKMALWISLDRDAITTTYQTPSSPSVAAAIQPDNYITSHGDTVAATSEKKEPSSIQNMAQPRFGIRSISRPTFVNKTNVLSSKPTNPSSLKKTIHDYEILDELGQGTYGFVKLAHLKSDPEKKKRVIKYVIKSRILVDCWTRDRKLGLIPAEIHVLLNLQRIPHENCCQMLEYFEDDDHYYIVMDLYGAGIDLFDYIELKNDGMSELEIRAIFRQVASAVSHLHSNRIVHRDIKDENVILDLKEGIRLIDFGSAAYLKDYAAPEILRGENYTGPPQDIWACGILLFTLIYRETPFYNIEEIMQGELRVPFVLSEDSLDLIKKMLERNVEKRLTIDQILEHPWLKSD